MVVVRSQRLVVLDTDKENEEWGSFFKHIRFKDESLANILKVMNLNSDSLQNTSCLTGIGGTSADCRIL